KAVEEWSSLATDPDATFDKEVALDAAALVPHVTWGTNPGQVVPIDGAVPSPDDFLDPAAREAAARALTYMGLAAGTRVRDINVEPQLRGPPRSGRAHPLGVSRCRRSNCDRWPLRYPGGAVNGSDKRDLWNSSAARPVRRRHRPDHPRRVVEAGGAHRLRQR